MNDNKPRFGSAGDDPLDRAIDRAVRAMMHVDPRAGLRRRVLSRIEAPSRRLTFFPRMAFATAALAVLVLAVMVMRRDNAVPVVPQTVVLGPQAPVPLPRPVPPTKEPASATSPGPTDTGRRTVRRTGVIDVPRARHVFGPPTGRIVGATVTDASVPPQFEDPGAGSESLGEDARSLPGVAALHIAPLEVKPLQIVPLGLPK